MGILASSFHWEYFNQTTIYSWNKDHAPFCNTAFKKYREEGNLRKRSEICQLVLLQACTCFPINLCYFSACQPLKMSPGTDARGPRVCCKVLILSTAIHWASTLSLRHSAKHGLQMSSVQSQEPWVQPKWGSGVIIKTNTRNQEIKHYFKMLYWLKSISLSVLWLQATETDSGWSRDKKKRRERISWKDIGKYTRAKGRWRTQAWNHQAPSISRRFLAAENAQTSHPAVLAGIKHSNCSLFWAQINDSDFRVGALIGLLPVTCCGEASSWSRCIRQYWKAINRRWTRSWVADKQWISLHFLRMMRVK